MADVPRIHTIQDGIKWIENKKAQLMDSKYSTNLRSARNDFEDHKLISKEIQDFGIQVERFSRSSASKLNGTDFTVMEASYSSLKELSEERQKCLETLLHIAEIEEYYQTLSAEVDSRALSLSSGPCPADNPSFAQDHESQSRTYNACIYAVRNTWSWLSKATMCMEIHLQNAAAYHEFYHELKHCDQGMQKVLDQLRQNSQKEFKEKTSDAQEFIKDLRELTRQLLEYQAKTESIYSRSGDVIPLKLRKEPLETPVKATSLVPYYQKDVTLEEGEEVIVLDNSQVTKWRIKTSKGEEALVPAIILLIPPPNRDTVHNAQRVRQQLQSTWRDCLLLIKRRGAKFFNKFLNNSKPDDMKYLTTAQREEVLNCLNDINGLLGYPDKDLRNQVEGWQNSVKNIKDTTNDRRGISKPLLVQWRANQKLLRHLEELGAYVTAYEEEIDSTRESQHFAVGGKDGNKFVSNAYIERMKPVELDGIIEEDENINASSVRHMTLSEKAPHRDENKNLIVREEDDLEVEEDDFEIEKIEEWTVERSRKMDNEDFEAQTIRETKTFIIIGVIDPRNGETISIYEAINEGIVSQTKGVYVNPDDGTSIPIPEAMHKGFIIVEYTNTSLVREKIHRGIITTTTTTESVSYSVQSVLHPVTGELISVLQAVEEGIIDPTNGRYINPTTGENLSVEEAIERGLMTVFVLEKRPRKGAKRTGPIEEITPMIVSSVYDPKTKRHIPLEDAIEKGLVDPTNGTYIDPLTGEVIPLTEASKRGVIKARLADPMKDHRNSNLITCKVIRMAEDEIEEEAVVSQGYRDINAIIFSKLKKSIDLSKPGIKEETSGREMTIGQAFDEGFLSLDPVHLKNAAGDKYTLHEAAALGIIDSSATREILSALNANDLEKMIKEGLIDVNTGMYVDPQTRETMTIADAIKAKKIDPDKVFFIEIATKNIQSLSSAIDQGKFNPTTGKFVNPRTGKELSLSEALDMKLIDPSIDQEKVMSQVAALKVLKKHMNSSQKGVINPMTGEELSLDEAVLMGFIDIANNEFVDPRSGQSMPLSEAVVRGLIDPKLAKQMFGAISKESLSQLLEQNCIDPKTGKYIDPDTKKKMSMQAAIDAGKLDPSAVFTVDPSTGQITSLATLIQDGKLNPESGKVIEPVSGREMSLSEAIANNFIDPHVDSEKVMGQISALKMLNKHMDTTQRGVRHPITGKDLKIEEALMLGILDIPHNEYVHQGRQKRLAVTEAVAEDLVEARVAKEVYGAISKETLANLLESNKIDAKTGKFIDPETGKKMSIKEAINQGLIDPNTVYLTNPTTGHVTSLGALIEQGKFNPETGKIVDPKNGKEISLSEAIQKKVLNPSVDVDRVATQMAALKALAGHVDPEQKGLKHPSTGEELTIEEAVMLGVLDLSHNEYIDPVTGRRMGFPEAMAQGLIDPQMAKVLYTAMNSNSLQNHIEANNIDPVDGTYTHPETNEQMTIKDAIEAGYLDPKSVFLVDPKTGEVTTMQALIEEGKFDPETSRVIEPDTGRSMNIADAIDARMVEPAVDVNTIMGKIAAVSLLKKHMDTSKKGVKHSITGEELSLEEAVLMGVIDIANNKFVDPRNGQCVPLSEAVVRGLIDPKLAKQMFGAISKESLSQLLEKNCIDPKTGKYIDPDTKKKMSMQAAIDEGKLDPSAVFTVDPSTGQITSLATLIQDGKLNPESGKVIDPVSGREMSLSEAIADNFIDPHVDSEKVMGQISALKMLNKHMDTTQRGVCHPITGDDLTIEQALMLGILDIPHNEYVHQGRQKRLSLPEAVAEDLVKARVAKEVYGAISKETLANLLESNKIDPKTGKFIDPETGKKMSIKEAINQGLIDPNTVYLIDPTTGHVTSLGALIEQGKFNPEMGKIVDPKNGKEISLSEAIQKKVLNPSVDVDKVATQMAALKALAGHVNPQQKGLKHPSTGEELTIEEAVMLGVLDLAHNEYIDPVTGRRMGFPEAMAQGLIDPQMAKALYTAMNSNSLQNHIEANNIDPVDGTYTHPETNEQMTIKDAIEAGYLDPKSVFLVDPKMGEVTTMQALIEEGKFDPETSRVIDPDTGHSMNIADAIEARVVEPAVDVNTIMGKIAAVSLLKKHMDTSKKGIKHSITGEELSLEEAVLMGVIDIANNEFVDPRNGQCVPLSEAVVRGLIDPKLAKQMFGAISKESLSQLLEQNCIDPKTGKYIDPDTKKKMSMQAAIDAGKLDPSAVFTVDPSTGQITSLATLIQDGKLNPESGKVIDPVSGREMSLSEAIANNFIDPHVDSEKVMGQISALKMLNKHMDTTQRGVRHPITGEDLTIEEALMLGILDIPHNEYVHQGRQRRLSLPEAVAEDLVDARVAKEVYGAISKETLANLLESNKIDPKTGKFIHPETGKQMSIKEAIEQGLIDPNTVYLMDPTTGHVTSLGALIEQGKFNPETGKIVDPKNGKEISLSEAIQKKVLNPSVDVDKVATQMAALKALAGHVDPQQKGLKHPSTGEELTIEEAVMLGVLDLSHNEYIDPVTGRRMGFPEAMAEGLIDPQMAKALYTAMNSNSLQNHIEANNIDPVDGTYTHPETNEQMTIKDAIEAGYLDPKSVFLVDPKTGEVTTMQALIEEGKFDPETSRVIDPDTGRNMNIADAIDARVIEPAVDVNTIMGKIAAVSLLKKHMDTSKKGIKHSITGEELSVEEAIMQDILDLPHNEYVNIITDEALGLPDAVSLGFIDPQIAKEIYNALGKESLGNLLDKNLIDPNSGKFIHPETKRKMTIKEAIDGGHLDPNAVFMIDPATGQVKSLAAFIDEDRFNPQTGKFRDPLTGLEVSIANALKKGIIEGKIDPEAHIESKGNLSDLIDGKGKGTSTNSPTFKAPDGTIIPLKEALALGYLTSDTVVKTDPKTGVVTLADADAEVTVMALMDTTEALDWVGDIEVAIANHQAPAEELLELEEQLGLHMNLKNEVEARQEPLEELLVKANELVSAKKEAKDAKKDQQSLRLKANANDLKARMQAVSTELDGRVRKLEDLRSDLENFHNHLDNMESWLGDAENELATIKQGVPSNDLGPQFVQDFSDFNEGAINKENDLDSLNKTGNKLKEKAKEFCKDAEKYRNSLQQPVDKEDVNPGGVIDEHLEATNAKYKTLVAECGDLMTRLTDTAAKNKTYNELKARLAETLPQMEARVQECSDDVTLGAGSNAAELLEALKMVTSDVISEGKLVEDLRSAGEGIIAILEELDCKDTPKAREIADTLTAVQTRFDKIQEDIVDKQHKVNAAIVQSQDVNHNLDALLGWVNETEAIFDNMEPVSLDREGLNEQMQNHKMLVRDIQNQREKADNVAAQCQGSVVEAEKVEQLVDRFDILESRAQQRSSDLEGVGQRVNSLYGQINQMEGWLNHALTALKRESVDGSPAALKDKIENMYRAKQGKQEDMDAIKRTGRELVEDPNSGNKHQIREALADVQSKWHDLTENLVSMISFAALREIDELLGYLDRAENEINTAEAISTDPETLAAQLRDHKAFHEDLESKKRAVNATIQKCNKLLRETTNAEADDVKTKLGSIRNQADIVCKLSQERLSLLEEALPLAGHFSETHADLQSWLGEIDAEITSLEVPAEAASEQIRKQLENAKTTQRIIEDHKPLVEDLNSTGHELSELCSDEDASDLKEDVDNVNAKYDEVKGAIREKLGDLDDALRSATTDVGDTIDGLLEELHYINNLVEHADPIAANPDALREQITENNTYVDDVDRRIPAIASAKETVRNLTPENSEEYEDLRGKLQDLDVLQDNIKQLTSSRGQDLDQVLGVSERFTQEYSEVIRSLRDIQDNLISQDSPGVDPSTISEQLRELAAIQDELEKTVPAYEEVRETGALLESLCGTPGRMELQKHMEDLDSAMEDISEGLRDRQDELNGALDKAERFNSALQSIMMWLPKAEDKFQSMAPVSAEPRTVKIQMEELKVFNVQVKPHYIDIQALNQYASELKNASPITAESLTPQVKEVNERWNYLLGGLQDREEKLKDQLVRLGEIDHALDDIIGYLTQTEVDLQDLDNVYGDPKFIETHLKKLQLIIKDLKSQEKIIKKLNKAVDEIAAASGAAARPLREKQEEMNEYFRNVRLMARDKQNQLQDILKEVKAFIGDVEDLTRWMNEFKQNLRSSAPMGALPETAEKEFHKYMGELAELERKEEEVTALLINGEDMLARCREGEADQLSLDLEKMKEKAYDSRDKAERKRRKLEEHLANVKDFHAMLKIHTDWLSNAEKILGSFKHPSKLVDRVLQQIQEHKGFKADIEAHREIMMNLDRTGTYLKYFGRKQDTVYIKNLLISIKLRWKKLVRRAEEKGRLLQQAHKEDKRFYESWKTLCDWLDESEKKLKKYTSNAPSKVKQDIDELKHFQHQLSSKHPVYYSTMRLGRNLKDRCTKSDPERDILQNMLEELKNRWTIIRSIVSQRQNKLDEALLSSGRFSDALASLLEWLGKAEAYLSEDQPILGDLDTVNILIEQHKAFQQELESRQTVVQVIKQSPAMDQSLALQLEELNSVWDRVNRLTDVREARLQDALKLAEDFNEAVQVVREWLPQAESVLKFRALPEDEDAIVNLMDQHDRFQDDLRGYQPNVERIKFLAEEILQACHPNAVRFVKYYLTITQTRWEQAVNRSNQRSERLHEALRNIRGNAALLEELLAWLTEAQALLSTKEKDPIPEDLTVVEALSKEHMEFHDDLSQKNKDVERLTKMTTARDRKVQFGSQYKLNESDSPSQRVTTLQNRWRNVWRMSVDRKKRLQDSLDNLLELESFKNFDFDLWRQRYIAWIRAKKLRITDFFRRQDKDGDGTLTRDEFVNGMLISKFPSNRTELNAVFDIFDRNRSGELDYREFVDALRPERQRSARARAAGKRPVSDNELIHDEIEQQISRCQCRRQFKIQKIDHGKYKFGDKQKICLVRFLNNTVMVRVGGGWVTLAEFLDQNDPCKADISKTRPAIKRQDSLRGEKEKAKGRTNTELREQFFLPEGVSQARANFTAKRRGSTPASNGTPRSNTSSVNNSPSASMNKSLGLSGSSTSLASDRSAASSRGGLGPKRRNKLAASWSNLATKPLTLVPTEKAKSGSMSNLSGRRHSSVATTPTDSTPRRKPPSSTSTTPRTPKTAANGTKSRLNTTNGRGTPNSDKQRPKSPTARTPTTPSKKSMSTPTTPKK